MTEKSVFISEKRKREKDCDFERLLESDEFREKFYKSLNDTGFSNDFLDMPIRVYLLWAAKNMLMKKTTTSRIRSLSTEFDEFVSVKRQKTR